MFSYDEFPYESATTRNTDPAHIAAVAHLFGLSATPVAACRVLELGCGTGASLIAFAARHPGARCIGVDLSATAIADGAACVAALGLDNVSLIEASIDDAGIPDGDFDFIIANGVYTWIDPAIRDRLFAICDDRLSPSGIAMFGYHTLPGWHFSGAARDILRTLTHGSATRSDRILAARDAADFLAGAAQAGDDFYGAALRRTAELIADKNDSHFFHEYLGDDNHPVYFRDFMAAAARHGLAYVWDGDPDTGLVDNFPPEVAAEILRRGGDLVMVEQWIDVLRNRRWRNSLLCRNDLMLRRDLAPERLAGCYIAGRLEAVAEGPAGLRLRDSRGTELTVANPASIAALRALAGRFPAAIRFEELAGGASGGAALAGELLRIYFAGALTITREPVPVVAAPSERPTAAPFARWQARHRPYATNQHHSTVALEPREKALLPRLDGTSGVAALAGSEDAAETEAALAGIAAKGLLVA